MGPTTAALLRYFRADQAFHEAQQKLDAATANVRTQGARVDQLKAEYDTAHKLAMTTEAKAKEQELDMKSRETRIETLRDRQQNATNQKEYGALVIEINTQKLDKSKVEEQALAQMEQAATQKKAADEIKARVDSESARFTQMTAEIDTKVKELTAQLETARGPRDEIAATLPAHAIAQYRRAADRFDGEAMAQIEKPDPRDIEYLCAGCNTYLVADIYNRLMSPKDDLVHCPSCGRILFVPAELTPEMALSKRAERGAGTAKPKKAPALNPDGTPKKRAPRKKKEPAAAIAAAGAPGSLAAAVAAGALAASGKGGTTIAPPPSAPLPSRADGTANVSDSTDAPDAPRPIGEEAGEIAEAARTETPTQEPAADAGNDGEPVESSTTGE